MVIWAYGRWSYVYGHMSRYGRAYGHMGIGAYERMGIWAYWIWDMVIWAYEQTELNSDTPSRRGRRIICIGCSS